MCLSTVPTRFDTSQKRTVVFSCFSFVGFCFVFSPGREREDFSGSFNKSDNTKKCYANNLSRRKHVQTAWCWCYLTNSRYFFLFISCILTKCFSHTIYFFVGGFFNFSLYIYVSSAAASIEERTKSISINCCSHILDCVNCEFSQVKLVD